MASQANGVNCGVAEWVKKKYFEMVWMYREDGESVKKVHVSESVGPSSRGRPPGRWRDRVKEYMRERGTGGVDQAGRECLDRERWRWKVPHWVMRPRAQHGAVQVLTYKYIK